MTTKPKYNLSTVFERTIDWDFGTIKLTRRMLSVLAHINGERSLTEIEDILNIPYAHLFGDIQRLLDLNLIKTCVSDHPMSLQSMKTEEYHDSPSQAMAV